MSDMPDYVRAVYTSVKNTWQDAENLDGSHGYITYIWIPEETFKVDLMKLHIYAEKFRAFSKTVKAGGGTTETSTGGGAHSHTVTGVTSGASSEATTVGGGAHSHDVTGATSAVQSASHTHTVTIGVKTSVAGGAHSHTVTGATSSSETPSHTHQVSIGVKTSSETGVHKHLLGEVESGSVTPDAYMNLFDINGDLCGVLNIDRAGTELDPHTFGTVGDHTHTVDVGTPTSESGGGNHSHTVTGQTAEATTDHTHNVDIGTPTSANQSVSHSHTVSGQTAEAVAAHTHGMAHTHGVSGQTAEAVANHTHDVVLADHTHDIDFGIYEESITGRTLSAILYNPDDVELKDFGVVLTGEDSDILDLTDYFETLTYGMYKIVLSASGRLRARLVFYELCKMYAQY